MRPQLAAATAPNPMLRRTLSLLYGLPPTEANRSAASARTENAPAATIPQPRTASQSDAPSNVGRYPATAGGNLLGEDSNITHTGKTKRTPRERGGVSVG